VQEESASSSLIFVRVDCGAILFHRVQKNCRIITEIFLLRPEDSTISSFQGRL